VSYFRELLPANEEVHPSIRPLLKLSRETIERCQKTEYALVSSLQRDPMLVDRIKRLKTSPGVGQITALTWALKIGDVSRFRTIKQAIELFRDWQRTQTQSSVRTLRSLRQQMDVWFCRAQEPMPRGTLLRVEHPENC
jgi:transposase